MLQLLTGKRAMELIRFYLMGYARLEEVIALLAPKKTRSLRSTRVLPRRPPPGLAAPGCRSLNQASPAKRCCNEAVIPKTKLPRISPVKAPSMPNSSEAGYNVAAFHRRA
jgi:hypothetical protein